MTDFAEIADPPAKPVLLTAAQIQSGPPVDPLMRVLTYSSSEWETFIEEWVSSLKKKYLRVLHFTGAGDKGIDIAGFTDDKLLTGVWDNYQCKHYDKPIAPNVALPEIGKILWYSFNKHYVPPRAYYFVAPKEVSTKLALLLANPGKLKEHLCAAWDKSVRDAIGAEPVPLAGGFFVVPTISFPAALWIANHEAWSATNPMAWGNCASDRGVDCQSAHGGDWLGAGASISHSRS